MIGAGMEVVRVIDEDGRTNWILNGQEVDDLKQSCPFCNQVFGLSDLFVHVRKVHKAYVCVYCQANFKFPKELMVHLHRLHRIPSQKFSSAGEFMNNMGVNATFLCVECNRLSEPQSPTDFVGFMSHKCQKSTGSCPKCGSILLLALLGDHVSLCKNFSYPTSTTAVKQLEDDTGAVASNVSSDTKCPFCSKSFPAIKLEIHIHSCSFRPRAKVIAKPEISIIQPQKVQVGDSKVLPEELTENLKTASEESVKNSILSEKEEEKPERNPDVVNEVPNENKILPVQEMQAVIRTISPPEKKETLSLSAARSLAEKQARKILGKEVSVTLEAQPPVQLKDRRSRDNSCRRCGEKVTASTIATHMRSCTGCPSPKKIPKINNLLMKAAASVDLKKRSNNRRESKDQEVVVLVKNVKIPESTLQTVMNPPNRPTKKVVLPQVEIKTPPLDPLLTEPDAGARLLILINGLSEKLEKQRNEAKRTTVVEKLTLIFKNLFSEMSDFRILNDMIQKSSRNCNYCRQVTLIRIDKRQLVIHLLYQHDWEVWSCKKRGSVSTDEPMEKLDLEKKGIDICLAVKEEKFTENSPDEKMTKASLKIISGADDFLIATLPDVLKVEKSDNSHPVLDTVSACNNDSVKVENDGKHSSSENEPLENEKLMKMEVENFDEPATVEWDDFKGTILRKVFQSENLIFSFERDVKKEFGEIPCECLLCGFLADSQKNLFPHWRKIHPGVAYKCVMCQGPFLYAGSLFSHLCTGTPQPFLNGPGSLSIGGVGAVTYTDTVFLKYQCGICDDLKLPGFFNYMVHLRKDHNKCELCLQTLPDQKQLERHMKKHQLNYFCWKCDKDYCIVLNYEQHLLWKHGTESETCSKCMKKRWPHIYHFCIPPDSFKCDVCGLVFTRAKSLRVHTRLHSGDNLKKCSSCTRKFVSKKLVQKHFQEVHITKTISDAVAICGDDVKSVEKIELENSEIKETDTVKTEDFCDQESESMDVTNGPAQSIVNDTKIFEHTNIDNSVTSPLLDTADTIEKTKDSNDVIDILDCLKDGVLEAELDKAQGSKLVVETDETKEIQEEILKSEQGEIFNCNSTAFLNGSSLKEDEQETEPILNGPTIEDVLDVLMDSLPVNSPDDSKKPFSLAEVQGPNLSEDESGSDSDGEFKSEKEIQSPVLSMPSLSQTPDVQVENKLTAETATIKDDTSRPKDMININEFESSTSASLLSNLDNTIPGIDDGMLDMAVAASLKNGDDMLSLNLNSSAPECEQKQQDEFGSMSPLLPPLDDFNFNVPEIPTFEDNSLPEHIIRENALFSLRLEHDYAVPAVVRSSGSNLPVKRKLAADGIDENKIPVRNPKKLKKAKKPVVLKETKKSSGKKKRRHSSSSSSSSSSSCYSSCGSNCSCSSKSSGSSSSSSDDSSNSSGSESDDSTERKQRPPEKKSRHRVESSKKKNKVKRRKVEKKKVEKGVLKKVKIKVKEPKAAVKIKKILAKPKQPKKCNKSVTKNSNLSSTTNTGTVGAMNDILRHFKNPEDAYILESDLDTDESGSDEAFHKKQLTEVIGKAPDFMDEVWTLGNELFLLRMVRGVSTLAELRPKRRESEKDVYSLKRSENTVEPRLKVRNVPIKPIIVRRMPEENGAGSVIKKIGNSTVRRKGELHTSLNLSSTGNTIMISRGIPNAATAAPASSLVRRRPPQKVSLQRKPLIPSASSEQPFRICQAAAAASVTKIAGTEMTLESVNRLTDETGSGAGDRPISSGSIPVVRKAKMKISLPKSKKTEQQQQHLIDETLYCICQCPHDNVSQMIGCDARECPYQWFHFECVGILIAPKGKWYCPECRDKRRRKAQLLRENKVDTNSVQSPTMGLTTNQIEGNIKVAAPSKSQPLSSNLLIGHTTL